SALEEVASAGGEQVDQLLEKGRDLIDSAADLIRERPIASFGVAFAAGWITAQLARRSSGERWIRRRHRPPGRPPAPAPKRRRPASPKPCAGCAKAAWPGSAPPVTPPARCAGWWRPTWPSPAARRGARPRSPAPR